MAMGADMKSSFAIQVNGRVYTSQYLGDLESYESQESFRKALSHMLDLLRAKPERIVLDPHPNYFSSRLGRDWLSSGKYPLRKFNIIKLMHMQCLLKTQRLHDPIPRALCRMGWYWTLEKIIRVWGGEFFSYENHQLAAVNTFQLLPCLAR
ncbi:MAG: hypothetical protein U5K54_11905 [Cytophagales bacterium]|nr:hypothetical protein [Cytophagales bacterium]